jgi:site-specific DNA-cytosine methylase
MKILIACEYSGTVRDAFAAIGHDVISCDLLPSEKPGKHYQGDVFDIINDGFDMMIAFPPCTHLAMSGAKHFEKKRQDGRQQLGIDFFMLFTKTKIPKVCIENPIGIMSTNYRKPYQIINPYDFGDAARKPTCLWLNGLPKLQSTNLGDAPLFGEALDRGEFHTTKSGKVLPAWYNLPPSPDRGKKRSKFFQGIANAMANQWGKI